MSAHLQLELDLAAPASSAYSPHKDPAVDAYLAEAKRAPNCRCESPIIAVGEYDDQRCIKCGRSAA